MTFQNRFAVMLFLLLRFFMNSLYYGLGLRSKYKNKNEDKDKVSERAVVNRFRNFNSPETCHIEPCIYESSIIVNLRRESI